jgi:hypothetical protein
MIHSVAYLDLQPQTAAAALKGVERWLRSESVGTLYACWYSSLGPLSRIMIWRGFETPDDATREAINLAKSINPYGAGEFLAGVSSNIFHEIDFAGPLTLGKRGPLFEVRDYVMNLDGLSTLMDLWRPTLPARLKIAPWVTAMYALTGTTPRVLHIYPWVSLDHRSAVRDAAATIGWPPRGAPAQISSQTATIYLASALSPLH